jgi:HAD superfamily hydrolase (TIGR01509 family)
MNYKAIIFDMDGTIVDSNHIWDQATQDIIIAAGGILTPEKLAILQKELKGLAIHASCSIIKEVMELEHQVEELIEAKQNRALELYEQQVHFIDGFKEFFKKVAAQKLKVAIATNADDYTLDATLKKLNLAQFFGKHIYNITHVNYRHKPFPDLYLYAAKQLNIDPKDCIAIEDSTHGIKAAIDAGMFCIGINTGKNRKHLEEAHLIIEGYDEIDLNELLLKR